MEDLINDLKKNIIETLNLEDVTPDDIEESAPLIDEGLGLDSIDVLDLVVMLEKHYAIKITDIEVGRKAFASLNALAEFITKQKK